LLISSILEYKLENDHTSVVLFLFLARLLLDHSQNFPIKFLALRRAASATGGAMTAIAGMGIFAAGTTARSSLPASSAISAAGACKSGVISRINSSNH
jgi:hypothetical protein